MNAANLEEMLRESSWSTTVGEVCDTHDGEVQTGPFGSQLHAQDYIDQGIPVVMPQDMRGGVVNCRKIARVAESHANRLARHILKAGDIVFSRRGDVSRFALIGNRETGWLCGTGSIRIRLNCNEIDAIFLRHYLNQTSVGNWLRHHAKGVTMPNLNTTVVRGLPLSIPPLPEQRRIAAILDKADALRAQRRAAIAKLDQLLQSVFLDMFGDPVTNPKGWTTFSLGELGEWKSGGTPSRKNARYFEGNIPWYSSGELNCQFVGASDEQISERAIRETAAKLIPPGAILVGMYDTAAFKSSITTVESSCNQAIAFGVLDKRKVMVDYLYHALQIGKEHFKRLQRGVRQQNLNLSMIRETRVPIPPTTLQLKFVALGQSISMRREFMQGTSSSLDRMFSALQQRAFTGQL